MKEKTLIKRNKEIKVRLTEAVHQALLERMEGGELATWIRKTCLDEKPNKKRARTHKGYSRQKLKFSLDYLLCLAREESLDPLFDIFI